MTPEEMRLRETEERKVHWRRWGPYLAERQWGTVREDYSEEGEVWQYFTHEQARSRAYRWGEDGLLGISDNHQRLCFALALWNGQDAILKERLFGLTGKEGNHGEDVKEYYYYLDNTPTHSYMKGLYKYPHAAFPYENLVQENWSRGRADPEFELLDTGVFADDRYFDVTVEYAKLAASDILIKIGVVNRGPETKILHVLPTLWFRNSWSFADNPAKPKLWAEGSSGEDEWRRVGADHPTLGRYWLYSQGTPDLLFTENETNPSRIFGTEDREGFFKDGIGDLVVHGQREAVNPDREGTKMAAHYRLTLPAGGRSEIRLRLSDESHPDPFNDRFEAVLGERLSEADAFYGRINPHPVTEDERSVQRQAFAGMLWTKQYYHYVVEEWTKRSFAKELPPPRRWRQRNRDWSHLYCDDVLSMPDKWEYPWFAAWDTAFHTLPLAMIDPDFAKRQLELFTREWYMHPNGQIPAYEWNFSDVNPPVHAWAAWRVYKIEKKIHGRQDRDFLERVFQKLLFNFTWWVNRKDEDGNNVFQGGFLGLDNIGVFNRSEELPVPGQLEQSDSTSWMAMYCLNMLVIALELAERNPNYEDIASKFFEHFLYIAYAMNHFGGARKGLWDRDDGFYYDMVHTADGEFFPLKVRSMVGLIPLFAAEILEKKTLDRFDGFRRRLEWFLANRPDLSADIACMEGEGVGERRLLGIVHRKRLRQILARMLDETEFLSRHGVRSLSRYHRDRPYVFEVEGARFEIGYEPAESTSGLFGGNSNWRGPVWFPLNFLLIESLQKYHHYYGDSFTVECPVGSGQEKNLGEVAKELSRRLVDLFLVDATGRRPLFGSTELFQTDPNWSELIFFAEYFNGDDGAGLGASHQTGWTGLVAKLIQQKAEYGF